jgi:hypothetical protein
MSIINFLELQTYLFNKVSKNKEIKYDDYKDEKIVKAQHVVCKMSRIDTDRILHHGIRVETDKDNIYLIENLIETGTQITNFKDTTTKWEILEEINVIGDKTLNEAVKVGSGYGTGILKYITGKTCIGTAKDISSYLNNKKETILNIIINDIKRSYKKRNTKLEYHPIKWIKEKEHEIINGQINNRMADEHIKSVVELEKLTMDNEMIYTMIFRETLLKYVKIKDDKIRIKKIPEQQKIEGQSLSKELKTIQSKIITKIANSEKKINAEINSGITKCQLLLSHYIEQKKLEEKIEIISSKSGSRKDLNVEQIQQLDKVIESSEMVKNIGHGLAMIGKLTNNRHISTVGNVLDNLGEIAIGIGSIYVGGVTFSNALKVFGGITNLIGIFKSPEKNPLHQMTEMIMGHLQFISNQINYLHHDMLMNFEKVFVCLGIIHKDIIKGFADLHKQGDKILVCINNLQEKQYEMDLKMNHMLVNLDLFHRKWVEHEYAKERSNFEIVMEETKLRLRSKISAERRKTIHINLLTHFNVLHERVKMIINSKQTIDRLAIIINNENCYSEQAFEYNMSYIASKYKNLATGIMNKSTWVKIVNMLLELHEGQIITKTQYNDIETLHNLGIEWIDGINNLQSSNDSKQNVLILHEAIDDYKTTIRELTDAINKIIYNAEKKSYHEQKIEILDQVKKSKKEFDDMKINISEYPQKEYSDKRNYGTYRGYPEGYNRVWFTRVSRGNQNPGCDVYNEWWYDISDSVSRRQIAFNNINEVNNTRKKEFFDSYNIPTLEHIELFNKIKPRSKSMIRVAKCISESGNPILPLSDETLINQKTYASYLNAEIMGLGIIKYLYEIVKNKFILTAEFEALKEEKSIIIYKRSCTMSLPTYYTRAEGIWNIWMGGKYFNGQYISQSLYVQYGVGNGYADELYYIMQPGYITYDGIKDRFHEISVEEEKTDISIINNLIDIAVKEERGNIVKCIKEKLLTPGLKIEKLFKTYTFQTNLIKSLIFTIYQKAEFVKLLVGKEQIMEFIEHHEGMPINPIDILNINLMMADDLVNKITHQEKDQTIIQMTMKLGDYMKKHKSLCVEDAGEFDETEYKKGIELGNVVGISLLAKSLYHEKYFTAAKIVSSFYSGILDEKIILNANLRNGILQGVSLKTMEMVNELLKSDENEAAEWLIKYSRSEIMKALNNESKSLAIEHKRKEIENKFNEKKRKSNISENKHIGKKIKN